MTHFTITIDHLVLTDLDLMPTQIEGLREQLASALQQELVQREWSSTATTLRSDRVRLPDVRVGTNGRLSTTNLARHLAQALPGTSKKKVGGKQ